MPRDYLSRREIVKHTQRIGKLYLKACKNASLFFNRGGGGGEGVVGKVYRDIDFLSMSFTVKLSWSCYHRIEIKKTKAKTHTHTNK